MKTYNNKKKTKNKTPTVYTSNMHLLSQDAMHFQEFFWQTLEVTNMVRGYKKAIFVMSQEFFYSLFKKCLTNQKSAFCIEPFYGPF